MDAKDSLRKPKDQARAAASIGLSRAPVLPLVALTRASRVGLSVRRSFARAQMAYASTPWCETRARVSPSHIRLSHHGISTNTLSDDHLNGLLGRQLRGLLGQNLGNGLSQGPVIVVSGGKAPQQACQLCRLELGNAGNRLPHGELLSAWDRNITCAPLHAPAC